MKFRLSLIRLAPTLVTIVSFAALSLPAQEVNVDKPLPLVAQTRVAPESGARTVGVRRDADGNYYVLNHQDRLVWMYNSYFVPRGKIGGFGQGEADLAFPSDFALTSDGKVVVADRAGDKVKIYRQNGILVSSFDFRRPWSVGVLSTGEILVSGFPRDHLISVYNEEGQAVRSIGVPISVDDNWKRNAVLNAGTIVVDSKDNIYYVFYYLPDPTIRKYNRDGDLIAEFHPKGESLQEATAKATEFQNSLRAEGGLGGLGVLLSLAVDETQGELWVSCASHLFRLGQDGATRRVYVFQRNPGTPINADHILVESDRLLITSSIHGVFAVPKPPL